MTKEIATIFLRLCATGRVREAYQRYAAPGFRHHNPYFRGGADSLRKAMEDAAHIFRFEDERVAELWDVAMEEPKSSPNVHGMF